MYDWRRWIVGAFVAAAIILVGGCGPNDRLRDNYLGKPTPPAYKPIQHDQNGNAIIPPDAKAEQ